MKPTEPTQPQQIVLTSLTRYPMMNRSMLYGVTGLKAQDQSQALAELIESGVVGKTFLTNSQRPTEVYFLAENREYLAPFIGNQK